MHCRFEAMIPNSPSINPAPEQNHGLLFEGDEEKKPVTCEPTTDFVPGRSNLQLPDPPRSCRFEAMIADSSTVKNIQNADFSLGFGEFSPKTSSPKEVAPEVTSPKRNSSLEANGEKWDPLPRVVKLPEMSKIRRATISDEALNILNTCFHHVGHSCESIQSLCSSVFRILIPR